MADLRAIGNKIRTLIDSAVKRDQAVTGLAGAAWAALAAAFRQMPIELQRIIFLAINKAIDRLGADTDVAYAIGKQGDRRSAPATKAPFSCSMTSSRRRSFEMSLAMPS